MARPASPTRPGRLATVLGPPPVPWVPPGEVRAEEPPTEPVPVVPRRTRRLDRLVPIGWRGARLDPGRPGALALALVVAVGAVVAAVVVWGERPRAEPVPALPAVSVSAPGVAASSGPPRPLVVSVSGKVRRPGLVRVPDGSRVADVVDAAGGALPGADLTGLNLARKIADGEQVAVGVPHPPARSISTPPPPPSWTPCPASARSRSSGSWSGVPRTDASPASISSARSTASASGGSPSCASW
jgi:competence protein ComEA